MPVLAVIPARLGATRLPRKPLRLLGGEPLVVRVYQRVLALQVADSVVVATDHDAVRDACAARGIPVVLTSSDHASGTDRVAEVARRPEFGGMDVLLNVQGDEPFVSREALAGAVGVVRSGHAPIGTAAVPVAAEALHSPDVVKVQALQQWVQWSPHPLELVERLEQLRPLAHGLSIGVAHVPAAEGGIDTEDDLRRANARWSVFSTSAPSIAPV